LTRLQLEAVYLSVLMAIFQVDLG